MKVKFRNRPQNNKPIGSLFDTFGETNAGGIKVFHVGEKFRVGEVDGVLIESVGPSFLERYAEKVEKNIKPAHLAIHKLKQQSSDDTIIGALESSFEIFLGQLWEFLVWQSENKDEEDSLLVYSSDNNGIVGHVYVNRFPGRKGWVIGCNDIEREAGIRILSLWRPSFNFTK